MTRKEFQWCVWPGPGHTVKLGNKEFSWLIPPNSLRPVPSLIVQPHRLLSSKLHPNRRAHCVLKNVAKHVSFGFGTPKIQKWRRWWSIYQVIKNCRNASSQLPYYTNDAPPLSHFVDGTTNVRTMRQELRCVSVVCRERSVIFHS